MDRSRGWSPDGAVGGGAGRLEGRWMRLVLAPLRRKGTASTLGTRFWGLATSDQVTLCFQWLARLKMAKERPECLTQAWTWV